MAGLIAEGDLYFNKLDGAGVGEGWLPFGNATQFEIEQPSDPKERISKQRNTYGSVLESVYIKQPGTLKVKIDDINIDNLALAFLGKSLDTNVSAGVAVTDSLTVIKFSTFLKTVNPNISNVVVKDVTDTTTYVLDTDYSIIDAELGMIQVIDGGAIVLNDVIHVTYDHTLRTSSKVQGGIENAITVELLLKGNNLVNGEAIVVNCWKVKLAPTTAVDFLNDEFVEIELDGRLELVTNKPSSFEVETGVKFA